LEVKFREQRPWEIGILITALEDDAMEFVVCYGYWEIAFCFSAGGETGEEFSVEKGYPYCLGRGSPVKKS